MVKNYTIGVIGAGRIGRIHIENLVHHMPDVKLKTVSDIKIDGELTSWIDQLGIYTLTDDVNDIFQDPDINAVIIASSTDTHAKFIQAAAKADKHIFCEKPIDTNIKRIKETISVIKEHNINLMVGFNRRFDPNFRRIYEAVSSGRIGEPHIIKITSRDPNPPPLDYIKVSGGIFIDMTIHDWDMARYLAKSEVEEVYTNGAVLIDQKIGKVGDIDTAVAVLKFKNNSLGIIDNSRQAVYGYDQRVEVFGSEGCVIAGNQPSNTVHIYDSDNIKRDKIPHFFLERYKESYRNELSYFFECLRKGKEPKPNGYDGLRSILIAKAAQMSLEMDRPVKISEVN